MQAAIQFDRFNALADEQAQERILAARARLGSRAVLLFSRSKPAWASAMRGSVR